MKQQRLDGLADGIFAIVMTLLAIELHVPLIERANDSMALWLGLQKLWPILISLILSFALLFTYWRAHHYIASVYTKNVTAVFANINGVFFLLITCVPFTAHLLGQYNNNKAAIAIYGVNVILIGLSLFWMRKHAESDPRIETVVITKAERRSGYVRILFPVFAAICAILVSALNTTASIAFFTAAILFNLLPASSNIIHHWLDMWFSDDAELIETNYYGSMNIHPSVHEMARDLRHRAPRSPYERIAGFALLARCIDLCRAHLVGKLGSYRFNSSLDQKLFIFKEIDPDEFKRFVEKGATDEEIGSWLLTHGIDRTPAEINAWSDSWNDRFDSVVREDGRLSSVKI